MDPNVNPKPQDQPTPAPGVTPPAPSPVETPTPPAPSVGPTITPPVDAPSAPGGSASTPTPLPPASHTMPPRRTIMIIGIAVVVLLVLATLLVAL